MIAKTRELLKLAAFHNLWDTFKFTQGGETVGKLVVGQRNATFILDLVRAVVESFGPWKWNPTYIWVRVKQARIERIGDLLYITGLWKNFTGADYAYQAITNLDGALQTGPLVNTSFTNIYSVPAYYPTIATTNKLALRTVKIGDQRYGYLLRDIQYTLRYNYGYTRIAPFFPCNDNGVPTSMGNISAWYNYPLPTRQEDFYDEYAVNFPKLPSDFGMHVLGDYAYYSTSAGVAFKIGSDGAPTTNPTHTYVISGYSTSLFPNQPTIVGVSGSYLVGTLLSTNTHTASITAGSGVRTEAAFLQVLGLFNADMSLHKVISTCHYNPSGAIGSGFNKVIVSSNGNIYWAISEWIYRVEESWEYAAVAWKPSDYPSAPVGYYSSGAKDNIDAGIWTEYNQGIWRYALRRTSWLNDYVLQAYSVLKGFNASGDAIPGYVSPTFEYDFKTYPFNITTFTSNGLVKRKGRATISTVEDDTYGRLYVAAYGLDDAIYGRYYCMSTLLYPYVAKFALNGVPLAFEHGITGALTVDSLLCIGDKLYVGGTPTSGQPSPLRRLNAVTGEIDPYVP